MPLFCAGGIATPADAALMMQLGAEGNFVGSGIFKSADPERRARAIVEATTHFDDPERVAAASIGLGEAMPGLEIAALGRRADAACCRTAEPELRVGVLAIQGDFEAHARMLRQLGAEASEVRTPEQLEGLDGLVIPGGESTTISKGIESAGLEPAIRAHHEAGRPILGTCAGMIVCDADHLGLIDATAPPQRLRPPAAELRGRPRGRGDRRRAAARGLHPRPLGRAPRARGGGARPYEGHPVAVREGTVLACAFHPELTDDPRFHAIFMAMVTDERARARRGGGAR